MARRLFVALGLLGAITIVVAPGCGIAETTIAEVKFAGAMFCPAERVHARFAPALVLEAPPEAIRDSAPWLEPVPPPGVAEDPSRMRLWMVKRDAEHAAWARVNELSQPSTNPTVAHFRAMQIYEVTGCDTTRLYACGDVPTRRSGMARGCEPIEKATFSGFNGHVVCKSGSILRAQTGRADGMITSCDPLSAADVPPTGAEPTSVASSADLDAAQRACSKACDSESSCRTSCESKTGAESATCNIDCNVRAAHCRLGCAATARRACEARGLAAIRVCAPFEELERSAASTEASLAKAQTGAHQAVEAAARVQQETATYIACSTACRAPLGPCAAAAGASPEGQKACRVTYLRCAIQCAGTSRERCESFAPNPNFCAGFRTSEEVLARAIGP